MPNEHAPPAFIVCVGASAGGLEALLSFFRHMPFDHLTFVVLQHMSPAHKSMLAGLIDGVTKVAVADAKHGVQLCPNHVYVCPPDKQASMLDGRILLQDLQARRPEPHLPIDGFMRSLADDVGPRAAGVVLSGTGGDGTEGLRAIRAAGGVTFAQSSSSARFNGMPGHAVDAQVVDFVMEPEDIGQELIRIVEASGRIARDTEGYEQQDAAIAHMVGHLRRVENIDLGHFKRSTLRRRVERRMSLRKMVDVRAYAALATVDRAEMHAFCQDLLINVTSFFRDSNVFAQIKRKVLPQLLERGGPQRVWVAACSTGEEAYSLAICFAEAQAAIGSSVPVQIYATDLDEGAIQIARRGIYPPGIALDVSRERLTRFFVEREQGYAIRREIRDMIVFSQQNLLADAPFSRMDLVTCRNLLIYLQSDAQKKALGTLRYALRTDGFLLLGSSESVADAPELFETVDRRHKIYRPRAIVAARPRRAQPRFAPPAPIEPPRDDERDTTDLAAPAAAAPAHGAPQRTEVGRPLIWGSGVDGAGPPMGLGDHAGAPPAHLAAAMATPGLQRTLKQAIARVQQEGSDVEEHVEGQLVGQAPVPLSLWVMPLVAGDDGAPHFLITLSERSAPAPDPNEVTAEMAHSNNQDASLARLAGELRATKATLSSIEERDSAYEELKVANEELQSANEELQSANEELEASREETQANNEELIVVNDEFRRRMAELDRSHDDLHNLLVVTSEPTIIVDAKLHLRELTASASQLLNLMRQDLGRRIDCLQSFMDVALLTRLAQDVMARLQSAQEEVFARNGRWYLMRVHPYKTLDSTIDGAVITFSDVQGREAQRDGPNVVAHHAQRSWGHIEAPVLVVGPRLRAVWANAAFLLGTQLSETELMGTDVRDLQLSTQDAEHFCLSLQETLQTGMPFIAGSREDLFVQHGRAHQAKVVRSLMPSGVPLLVITFASGA